MNSLQFITNLVLAKHKSKDWFLQVTPNGLVININVKNDPSSNLFGD